MDSTLKALHRNVAEWLAGPAGAVVLHLAILLALLFLVDFSKDSPDSVPVDVTYLDPEPATIEPLPPPLDLPPPPESVEFPPDFEPVVADFSDPELPEAMDFSTPDPQAEPVLAAIPEIDSPVVMSHFPAGAIQNRLGAGNRERAGRLYGGEGWEYAESAVRRALEWLRLNQNAEGSWGTSDREAMSGLALLTFLAHGETTASEKYGETVRHAIQYLLARQNDAGEFAKIDTTAGTYAQAICVYALSEAYGMTRILALKAPMEKGVAVLIQGQQAQGGFDYRFAQGPRRDTSLGGWCCQALKAAFIAGAETPKLKTAMDLAVVDMKSAQNADGSFAYSDPGSHATPGITAVAVLSLQLLGHGREHAVAGGLDYLRAARCDWKNPPDWPMYAWYYVSQTKFHQGGGSWKSWNNQFAPQFIRNQNPDGSWTSAGLARKAGTAGRENLHPVYATTLAALTLQVYHRFLPTYAPIETQVAEPAPTDDAQILVL